jgi:hypothetical protein
MLKECVAIESRRQRGKFCAFPHCLPIFFVLLHLVFATSSSLLFVDYLCRAPFIEPVFPFPKEYIDMLKDTFLG